MKRYIQLCAAALIVCFSFLTEAAERPTVVFMSDFGTLDDSVAICKGVMLGIGPDLRIIDLTHEVRPFSILDGARFLTGATPYYPAGTIFLVVVDPGVGSTRKPLVVKSKKGQYFVLPDNGLMTLVLQRDGLEGAREISNPEWMLPGAKSSTFHGRDIFSPVAAHLAEGWDWQQVGPETKNLVQLKIDFPKLTEEGLTGEIVALDGPYGNSITNIDASEFSRLKYTSGDIVNMKIDGRDFHIPFVKTFSDVPVNQPLLYIDSRGHLALAINQGSFAEVYDIHPPVPILFSRNQH